MEGGDGGDNDVVTAVVLSFSEIFRSNEIALVFFYTQLVNHVAVGSWSVASSVSPRNIARRGCGRVLTRGVNETAKCGRWRIRTQLSISDAPCRAFPADPTFDIFPQAFNIRNCVITRKI